MLKSLGRPLALACAFGAAGVTPAVAGVVDFEDVMPGIYFPGDPDFGSFTSGGMNFRMSGLDFGVVDTAEAFFFGNAPAGSTGQFYAGLNDYGWLTMTSASTGLFSLQGFDFGFVAPLPGVGIPGLSPGLLVAFGTDAAGNDVFEQWDFGSPDDDGNFAFATVGAGALGAFSGVSMRSVTFAACVYFETDAGELICSPADNLAQFALDNIRTVPVPASLAITLLGLGLLTASRRRGQ